MSKKIIKESKNWKPKSKWMDSFTIDLKTGKAKYHYFIPETPEEEKRLKAEYDEHMGKIFDILLSDHFSKKPKDDIT